MKLRGLFVVSLCGLAACAQTGNRSAADATAPGTLAVEWNHVLLASAEQEDGFLTLKGVRAAAMMHAAMHDALNAVSPRYQSYALDSERPQADPVLAAARAAHAVACDQYPESRAVFDAQLERTMGASEAAHALGRVAADAVLARRRGDRWDGEARYQWHPMGPGVYAEFQEHSDTPEGFVFGAGLRFTMDTPWVDRAGPLSGKMKMEPPSRSFDGFRAAALECALSRIYLGIHFRYDSEEGNRLGRRIGRYAVENFLGPLAE